jgi:ATP-binding cassette subfamily C protein EexD
MAIDFKNSLLLQELQPMKTYLKMAFFFSLFVNMLMIVPAMYMLQVYDRAVGSRSDSTLLMLTLIMVFLLLSMGGLEWVRSQVLIRAGAKMDQLLSERLYNGSFAIALRSGGMNYSAQPLSDLTALRQFITGPALFAVFDAPWVPFFLFVMYLFHPWFLWLGIFAVLILVTITLYTQRRTEPLLEEATAANIKNSQQTTRNLRNAEVVESMGMMGNVRKRWAEKNFSVMGLQAEASDRASSAQATSKALRQILQSCALGLGAYLAINQELTGGMMIAGSILLGRCLAPIDQLTNQWKGFIAARGQFERLEDLLQNVAAEDERMSLPAPTGAITVENMSAMAPGSQDFVLKGISFSLAAGESLAVVGPSAAGKSTLMRVLLGIWPTSVGAVRLDGAEVFKWDRQELGPHIGYLPQDVELFDGTISENIARFGEIDSEKIVEAAQLAGVHELILRLPEGYDTEIGATGGVLSGGQRQRVGLARALYGEPRLVVLDEPNSNLDDVGEAALRQALLELKRRGVTVIIVSHRQSVLSAVDKVMILSEGALAGLTTAQEFRESLVKAQQEQAKARAAQQQSAATTPVQTVAVPTQ